VLKIWVNYRISVFWEKSVVVWGWCQDECDGCLFLVDFSWHQEIQKYFLGIQVKKISQLAFKISHWSVLEVSNCEVQ
jgi:hypothetical protein